MIDDVGHLAILQDTSEYILFCGRLGQGVIHHTKIADMSRLEKMKRYTTIVDGLAWRDKSVQSEPSVG